MTPRPSQTAAFGAVALLLGTLTVWLGAPPAAAAVGPGAVKMTVDDVRPNSPELSNSPPHPLAISLTLTNVTNATLKGVTVSAVRGDPIGTQKALDAAIAKPKAPSEALVARFTTKLTTTLAPHVATDLVFRTKTDIPSDAELCLCANAIYPLYFTADYPAAGGGTTILATTQTYLPSFLKTPAKARVGWLWPLLDRPHRLTSDTVFTDDDLADEVRTGGRLDQLLTVVEQVAGKVPMTLVTDPDLIDELAVMSTGYKVRSGNSPAIAGSGSDVAKAWLQRLRAVLDEHPAMELDFTPFADPAVESLSQNRLSWPAVLSTQAQARVTVALGGGRTPLTDIAWPVGGAISESTLSTLVGLGTKTVVVPDKALPRGSGRRVIPDALAPVRTGVGQAIAAVTSTPIERRVSAVLAPGGQGLAALPELVAELAIRVVTSLDRSHYILITPPRDLTVDPEVASRTILATSVTSWSSPLPLRAAASSITPVDHGPLRRRVKTPQLPAATLQSLHYVTEALPTLASLYTTPAIATARLGAFPSAMQRCESTSLLLQDPRASATAAARLESRIRFGIQAKVYLVHPSDGTYTLTSKNSPLPITVWNKLADDVRVKINIRTVSGAPVLSATDLEKTIKANSKVQLRVPTSVDHVGHILIRVTLSTPDGLALGKTIQLTVRSTALGTIGVVITIAAAVVLALALLVRLIRRMTKRSRSKRPPPPPPAPEPAPAATASP